MAFWAWSKTPASNATADSTINWAEGMAPSAVNDSARAQMARTAEWRDDISGTITTAGSSTAYTLTSNQVFDSLAHMNGAMIAFIPHTNCGATVTLAVDGLTAKALRSSPSVELLAGALVQGTVYICTYVNADNAFYLQSFYGAATTNVQPQGYLTLTSGTPIIASDVSAATAVYYTPYIGQTCPIYNGSSMVGQTFAEQTLTLVSNHLASTIYDVFAFMNSGVFTIGTGPAWNASTAGSGARGTGAGTTELQRVSGILTNKVAMTARNSSTTYSVSANQGTYLGSISIDSAAGQVTCHRSYGQSRKWGIWNAFNRAPIVLKAGDNTASWTTAGTLGPVNAASTNLATAFCGLAEEMIDAQYVQQVVIVTNNNTTLANNAIGWNSTSAASGKKGIVENIASAPATLNQTIAADITARYVSPPSLGLNNAQMLEATPSTGSGHTANGTETSCLMTVTWRG